MRLDSRNNNRLSEFTISPVTNLFEISQSYYQPNFILINGPITKSNSDTQLFGDILPVYRSYKELTNIIVTTWEGINHLIILSSTFAVCLLSLVNNLLQNTVYQSYLILNEAYQVVLGLPEKYNWLRQEFSSLINTISNEQTRDLWWLELKIDTRSQIKKITRLIETFWLVTQKFYLAIIVLASIGILNFISFSATLNNQPSSFLSKFIQNYSLVNNDILPSSFDYQVTTLSVTDFEDQDIAPIQKIAQYEVGQDENIEEIAQMHGVTLETLNFNNNLTSDQLQAGQKLYIPWIDGYIYTATSDISVDELSTLYGVSKEVLINENTPNLNKETNKFAKDTLVLIPTTDFNSVSKANQLLASQRSQQEKEQNIVKRDRVLKQNSVQVAKGLYKDQYSGQQRENGFIMPTTGYYSRHYANDPSGCGYSRSHRGCDIASTPKGSKPPVYAVQKGVVVRVGYESGGYGNFMEISHGNGLSTLYAHLEDIYVKSGDIVPQGQAIGQMGSTGRSTGVHLHFEVHVDGVQVNPRPYLP